MEFIRKHPHCIEERAKKYYGTTDVFEFAGYILHDGIMLNFSHEGRQRDVDHRDIGEFFKKAQGVEAMVKFMKRGNIRCMCDLQGYRFEFIVPPTKEQVYILREAARIARQYDRLFPLVIEQSSKNGKRTEMLLDIDDLAYLAA